ncbi:MAG: hypothetical protein GY924_13745, partial [Planctomycetaceae bacterium]|nr:hypothetical protein [Planctomycetaceae bacterium]
MRKRPAALVSLTAMLLVSLISTSQFIAAAEYGPEGPEHTESGPKNSGTENSESASKAASEGAHAVKETVERALPYLERAGEAWIEKRQCVSCHQVPFMLWSLSAAETRGYPINRS